MSIVLDTVNQCTINFSEDTAGTVVVSSSGGAQGVSGFSGSVTGTKLEVGVAQGTHNLVVKDVVRRSGGAFVKAQADSAEHAEVVGIVSAKADNDNFTLLMSGYITTLSGLTDGVVYYLDPSTAGAITATEPTTPGQVSKPLLIADSTTSGFFINFRGLVK